MHDASLKSALLPRCFPAGHDVWGRAHRKRLRRSYTDEGMDPHEPLLVGSDYDSDHDSSRADSGRGSHSHGGR